MRKTNTLTIGAMLTTLVLLVAACGESTSNTPNPFSFTAVSDAEPGVVVRSNEAVISGITDSVPGSVSAGGTLIVDGSAVGSPTQIHNGARLAVEVTSSTELGVPVSVTVTVGGFEAVFTVTTREGPGLAFEGVPTEGAPGDVLQLNWTVDAALDTLELTSSSGLELDVSGQNSAVVTLPGNAASVIYTLTGSSSVNPDLTQTATTEVAVPLWVCENPTDVFTFEDLELEEYFRQLNGVPVTGDLTCALAQSIVEWRTPTWQDQPGTVESIVGIQHLTNLEVFWAEFNDISDLTPVAGLTNLQVLHLDGNRVLDLSPIANLTELTLLGLWDNGPIRIDEAAAEDGPEVYCRDGISDISPLENLVNLEILYLSCNNVTDISAIGSMVNLELAFVILNQIESIAPLSGLTNLQALRFSENLVASDEGVLATLTSLRWLEMAYNRLEDDSLAGLAVLPDIFALDLEGNYFTDLSPIISNAALPAAVGTGDGQEPLVATVSLGYNCIVDPVAVQTALIAQGFAVVGVDEPGAQQRPDEDCVAGPPTSSATGSELLERMQSFRKRTGMR